MPPPCLQARIAAFFEFTAGRGAPFVNAAGGLLTNPAIQRCAARGAVVGAAHAAGVLGDGGGQPGGHLAAAFFVFKDREIHPEAGTAGSAGGALAHGSG